MRIYNKIKRLFGKAVFKYEMLNDKDFILIALSGGEDSLVLAYFLHEWRRKMNFKYRLLGVHLDMGFAETPEKKEKYREGVKWLEEFCRSLDIEFYFEETNCAKQAKEAEKSGNTSPCFVCSWHRRKHLFKLAEKTGANKIAFGHHLDDVIVTFFINMFYSGELSTIVPVQEMFKGKLYLIRPLFLIEKDLISKFVKKNNWKVLENPCPFSKETKRKVMENFLKEKIYPLGPKVKKCIVSAIFNPRPEYLPKKVW
jgi:tRNA 2-thiocytidine biosynthesis protein TtcA